MSERYIEFLVDPSGKSPDNLKDSISFVKRASKNFIRIWPNGDQQEAIKISQEAFTHLDYIQNELLRQRDIRKSQPAGIGSPLRAAFLTHVGNIVDNVMPSDREWFLALNEGAGTFGVNIWGQSKN